ncbi:MAG: tRNA (N6-threonylcarbamoyladenosine(37)-N6)-methyltransferase TrmO [Spirochaetota bacterium]
MAYIEEIGIVHSRFNEPADPFEMKTHVSTIEVFEAYTDGLFDIESNTYLQVLFHFHKSESVRLKGPWYYGDQKGVFACRSPYRPGAIGLTTVELLSREGNVLTVRGLDALNHSPVLDIKPFSVNTDMPNRQELEAQVILQHPRAEAVGLIRQRHYKQLLVKAATLHGHFCPGLALGVVAAVDGLHALAKLVDCSVAQLLGSEGLEELVAIIEINSCFADGIQFVSGCTFGNNSLLYKDTGKTAVTFALRGGQGIRIVQQLTGPALFEHFDPEYRRLFDAVICNQLRDTGQLKAFKEASRQASLSLLDIPSGKLFSMQDSQMELPDYAPMRATLVCSTCGESFMEGKEASREPLLCRSCAGVGSYVVDGSGIRATRDK